MKTVVGRKNRAPHGNGLPKALFSIRKQLSEEHLADGFQVIFKMFFTIRGGSIACHALDNTVSIDDTQLSGLAQIGDSPVGISLRKAC